MPESTRTFAAARAASFQAALDVLTGRGLPPWADLEQAIEYLGRRAGGAGCRRTRGGGHAGRCRDPLTGRRGRSGSQAALSHLKSPAAHIRRMSSRRPLGGLPVDVRAALRRIGSLLNEHDGGAATWPTEPFA